MTRVDAARRKAAPKRTGFASEKGAWAGEGMNTNVDFVWSFGHAEKEKMSPDEYRRRGTEHQHDEHRKVK